MKETRDITITNSAFSITIHWNGQIVATQLCILAGLILLKLFANNHDVKVLCNVVMLIDVISMVVAMFWGGSIDAGGEKKEGAANKAETAVKTETTKSSEPPASKEEKKPTNHSSTQTTSKTIKKRVPIPAQQGMRREESKPEPEPVQVKKEQVEPVNEEPKQTKPIGEMSDEDLNDLFNW